MKISKLFHWLYAILMLLPFLVFLPNAFYYGFNEHAVAQEKTEQIPVYYPTNRVVNTNDLIVDNYYKYNNNFTYENNTGVQMNILQFYLVDNTLTSDWKNNVIAQMYIAANENKPKVRYQAYDDSYNTIVVDTLSFNFKFVAKYNSTQYLISRISETYIVDYYITNTTNMSITDSMSYSWDSVWQNDLFSWSYGSFLTEPFIYIGNVFNVPVDNSLYYALSYWLDISIIWLCFDVIMYVPLLVHRWLDKGIVE